MFIMFVIGSDFTADCMPRFYRWPLFMFLYSVFFLHSVIMLNVFIHCSYYFLACLCTFNKIYNAIKYCLLTALLRWSSRSSQRWTWTTAVTSKWTHRHTDTHTQPTATLRPAHVVDILLVSLCLSFELTLLMIVPLYFYRRHRRRMGLATGNLFSGTKLGFLFLTVLFCTLKRYCRKYCNLNNPCAEHTVHFSPTWLSRKPQQQSTGWVPVTSELSHRICEHLRGRSRFGEGADARTPSQLLPRSCSLVN